MAATMAAHCGQLVQVQDESDGRFSRPGSSVGSSSSCGDGSDDGWTKIPPAENLPPSYLDAVNHSHLTNRDQHHRCSRLQPQSQLKYQSKDSSTVIESMKDEVMRNFIRPPPNRIVVCCDCPCMFSSCRHHLPHHPNINPSTNHHSNINPSTNNPPSPPFSSAIPGSNENRNECRTKRKSTDGEAGFRSEPESTRSSSSFSHHFFLPSGFRIKSLRNKNIISSKSSIKDDGGRSRKSNNNNNDTAASFSSSNKSIHSYFQSSSLIPTIFVSSSSKSSSS